MPYALSSEDRVSEVPFIAGESLQFPLFQLPLLLDLDSAIFLVFLFPFDLHSQQSLNSLKFIEQ